MTSLPQSYTVSKEASSATPQPGSWLNVVKQQVDSLKFGAVTITIHEGRVVQVETSSKIRFERAI